MVVVGVRVCMARHCPRRAGWSSVGGAGGPLRPIIEIVAALHLCEETLDMEPIWAPHTEANDNE